MILLTLNYLTTLLQYALLYLLQFQSEDKNIDGPAGVVEREKS